MMESDFGYLELGQYSFKPDALVGRENFPHIAN
jgi:hypothetical protein